MMTQKGGTLLFVTLCIGLIQMVKTQSIAGRINLEINERGTKFTERVEISSENTATYHVPAHNDIEKSDVFIDYKQKLSVTRIPRLKECHIEDMSDDESSPEKIMMDIVKLKLIYKGKPKRIQTISRTLIKNGIVNAPSLAIAKFCGNFPIFKMAVIEFEDSDVKPTEHRIKKRSAKNYLKRIRGLLYSVQGEEDDGPTVDDENDDGDKGDGNEDNSPVYSGSGSGYGSAVDPPRRPVNRRRRPVNPKILYDDVSKVRCKTLENYNLDACIDSSPDDWSLTPVVNANTCMYQVKCRDKRVVNGKTRHARCFERHVHSREVCYNVSCKKSLPVPVFGLK